MSQLMRALGRAVHDLQQWSHAVNHVLSSLHSVHALTIT